jgi:hypothetical protein
MAKAKRPFAEVKLRSADRLVSTLAVCTILPPEAYCAKDPRATSNRQPYPSNMQWARIKLLPRSHGLPACNRLLLLAHFVTQFSHR